MKLENNISLKPFNTFGLDASAKYFIDARTLDDLKEALSDSTFQHEKRLILGGGSNILLTKDYDGLVLKNSLSGVDLVREDADFYFVKAQGGEVWHNFVLFCIANDWAGIENLSLIPGCVGASPMQNIGAYGVEVKDRFESLEALNVETLEIETFDLNACEFGYRESIFKRALKGQHIIVSVTFKLFKKPQLNTSYGAIETELEKMKVSTPSIKEVSDAVIAIRSSKLPDPKKIGNSGSFFKNPVISNDQFAQIIKNHPTIAHYPAGEGYTKVAAGWLIDQAGWKGKTMENYGVHKNQALVLVNYGGANGQQILDLSQQIMDSIANKYGINLEREVNII